MLCPRRHYDVLARLLFIYAKVNPGLCYVQGMNEILAPIYYALMTDPTYTDFEQVRKPEEPLTQLHPAASSPWDWGGRD